MTEEIYLLEWCRGDLVLYFKTLKKVEEENDRSNN